MNDRMAAVGFPPLVSAEEMRLLEERAIVGGIPEERLMDEAGAGMARVVREWLPQPGVAVIFAGKGHNGGDALVLAALMLERGWRVEVRLAGLPGELRPLTLKKWRALEGQATFAPVEDPTVPAGRPLLLVDGLLGIGGGGLLRGAAAAAVAQLNALRQKEHALTLAVDLPSGLNGDPHPVMADVTVTAGWPKELLFADHATAAAGRLVTIPLTGLAAPEPRPGRDVMVTAGGLRGLLLPRPAFARHKGETGRVGILAGSTGLTGAARLASTAAVMMGGGLVTLFCPHDVYPVLASACPPEVMVRPVADCQEVAAFPLDALGVGPGLGASPLPGLLELIWHDPRPMVVDADALNLWSASPGQSGRKFAGPRLFTPHPGELKRLTTACFPSAPPPPRRAQALALAEAFGISVLAKSARSLVISPGRPAAWNSSGHPLMARGGMGDVLTGFLTAFAAQGLPFYEAAALGSWLLGRGGELYHARTGWEEPGLASEVMHYAAGPAMAELRAGLLIPGR